MAAANLSPGSQCFWTLRPRLPSAQSHLKGRSSSSAIVLAWRAGIPPRKPTTTCGPWVRQRRRTASSPSVPAQYGPGRLALSPSSAS